MTDARIQAHEKNMRIEINIHNLQAIQYHFQSFTMSAHVGGT